MPKPRKEKPYQYRTGPDGEPILPGFFSDYGGYGNIVLVPSPKKSPDSADAEQPAEDDGPHTEDTENAD